MSEIDGGDFSFKVSWIRRTFWSFILSETLSNFSCRKSGCEEEKKSENVRSLTADF